ncbi:MAG: DNA polymerase III subunit beta [bacterium]|nr:DNA polymerase III subunit beta [bacterium]
MRFSCTQENLMRALLVVSRIASRAGNLPILSNIHIKAEAEGVMLKATNLEVGVTCTLRGKIEAVGEFTVPAKLFTDYISSLPKENIDIELKEQTLSIHCGAHNTKIKGMPAADFPLIPTIEDGSEGLVSLPSLLEGIEQVVFSVSAQETRPEISGALLSLEEGKLTLAGTDSYRLAEKVFKVEGNKGKQIKAIIPLRALQELSRICALAQEEAGSAKLIISSSQFAVVLPSTEFVSRVIEGQYPDYRAIVPTHFGVSAIVSKHDCVAAIRAAGLFSKAGIYDVVMNFDTEKGNLEIASLNAQTGEYASGLPCQVQGQSAKISYNWKYLLEGVQALDGEQIVIKATDSASPTMLTAQGVDDYFYIVMPIKE